MIPALAIVLALLSPIGSGVTEGCPNVEVVGVRGSGQSGYGAQVGGVVDGIVADTEQRGLTVDDKVLDYPAVSLADTFGFALFTGEYDRSVQAGVDALIAELDATRGMCPATEIFLVGYSQGAQVIKQAMLGRGPIDRIGSVILLGDPTRDVLQIGLVRLGDTRDVNSGSLGAVDVSDQIRPLTIDFCAVNDSVCSGAGINFDGHIAGYTDSYAMLGPLLASELQQLVPRYRLFF